MKSFIVVVLLIIFGFFAYMVYENDAQDRAWETFIVDHHCKIIQRPQGFFSDGRILWNCDGATLLHF